MNRSLPTFAEAEARNKLSHFTVQGFDLNGIMHAGANDGEEIYNYLRFGIDYIVAWEPLRSAFDLCVQNCAKWQEELGIHPTQLLIDQQALGSRDGIQDLNVTAGDGKGSSLFLPDLDHPEVKANWNDGQGKVIAQEKVLVNKFTTWYKDHPEIDLANYDTLVLDTQGNEMDILHGMRPLLSGFKYLCIELSLRAVYKGETHGSDVANWLEGQGFILDSPELDHNDWFFVRKDIKAESDRVYQGKC